MTSSGIHNLVFELLTRHLRRCVAILRCVPVGALLFAAGCASTSANRPLANTGSTPDTDGTAMVRSSGKGTGMVTVDLTCDDHPSGAAVEVRQVARDAWLYAQLAENAYGGGFKIGGAELSGAFDLPSYVSQHGPTVELWTGFAVRTYMVRKPRAKPYVVLAFRGTQFNSIGDWFFGNIFNTQLHQGWAHARKVKANLPPGTRIVATGHSLGAAIATFVSLNEEGIPAYGFNASGRLTRGRALENPRTFVSQRGEVNVIVRRPFINAGGTYTTINCLKQNQRMGPLGRHEMGRLAACLTRIAASARDGEALKSVRRNNLGSLEDVVRPCQ
jgi:hypothetical protein